MVVGIAIQISEVGKMRNLRKNKQHMYYSLFLGNQDVYKTDKNGNIVYDNINGVDVPMKTGTKKPIYSKPKRFDGNISLSNGDAHIVEYGIDTSQYGAVLVVDDKTLDFNELTLIWHTDKPRTLSDGSVDTTSADYQVKKLASSLNEQKYLLQKLVK